MKTITFEITDLEQKVLANQCADPQDWIENAVLHLCELAKDQLVQTEIDRMIADPNISEMSTDRNEIVSRYNGPLKGNPGV